MSYKSEGLDSLFDEMDVRPLKPLHSTNASERETENSVQDWDILIRKFGNNVSVSDGKQEKERSVISKD